MLGTRRRTTFRAPHATTALLALVIATTATATAMASDTQSEPGPRLPSPVTTLYFAEGYTGPGFDQYLTIQNPGATPATVNIEYQTSTGTKIESTHTVAPTSRHTVNVNAEVGHGQEISTKITSTQPILAERPMYFTYKGAITGGHVVPGQSSPATTLYFAEGYTGPGFAEYLTLQNPNPIQADIEVTYQTSSGSPLVKAHTVSPQSRYTINVNADAGPNQEVSTKITSTQPILAERPMYFTYKGAITGGHVIAGQVSGLITQYFAEGYTGPGFAEYLTFQNTSSTDARVTVAYQFPGGVTADTSLIVQAGKRRTLNVSDDLGTGVEVSARVASDQPIVVERPMYFIYKGDVTGGHVGAGVTGPAAIPEPYLSGSSRIHHRGIGPIRAGMPIDEAAQLGGFAYTLGYDYYGDGSCLFAFPAGLDVAFMVSYGIVARADTYGASPNLTAEGLGIGSTATQVINAYQGRTNLDIWYQAPPYSTVQVDPVLPTNFGTSMVFSTNSDVVIAVITGNKFHAELYDGCV